MENATPVKIFQDFFDTNFRLAPYRRVNFKNACLEAEPDAREYFSIFFLMMGMRSGYKADRKVLGDKNHARVIG